ncbi:zinc metallochaperone AztD [Microtetraspora sp. NBRC 16547]|uniref:zinc metallochaperone AztD n=1 Tax=Microtetraspora sp. NBRC 16547 TaxID=3030993 RepID=UPI0025546DF0|nr:zinc metallochaperone AztD [Microtetraspora sp. NBRC 16547]
MNAWPRTRVAALPALLVAGLLLSACTSRQAATQTAAESAQNAASPAASPAASAATSVANPLVTTCDGGLYVLDGETLQIAGDIPLPGFNRVNPAGDDHHVLVSTSTGFRVLDAISATLKSDEFAGAKPGHVVRHAGKTVLFSDGTGVVTVFDPKDLAAGLPKGETYTSAAPHHGVAIELANGELLTTLGTEEKRLGILVLDRERKEIARSEKCPGVHGEAAAKDEAVVIGCEDGVLLYKNGTISKIDSPDPYGRVGNQAGSEASAIVLGDYKTDPDAEREYPERVSLIDTESGSMRLVDLGTSYTFRSLARGPRGEALVLGTDGRLHVIDPEKGKVVDRIEIMAEWREPLEWQQPRPTLFVRGHTAYVTDPSRKELHAIDIESRKKLRTVTLPQAPNELSGVSG